MRLYATEAFRKARLEQNVSQRELSRKAGLFYTFVNILENQGRATTEITANKLSALLDRKVEELFTGDEYAV